MSPISSKKKVPISAISKRAIFCDSSRESTLFMAEQFAFQKVKWNSGAIELYERASTTWADIVNRPSDQFLARASFAEDQRGGIGRRPLLNCHQD
jgi:hypothetical protein